MTFRTKDKLKMINNSFILSIIQTMNKVNPIYLLIGLFAATFNLLLSYHFEDGRFAFELASDKISWLDKVEHLRQIKLDALPHQDRDWDFKTSPCLDEIAMVGSHIVKLERQNGRKT